MFWQLISMGVQFPLFLTVIANFTCNDFILVSLHHQDPDIQMQVQRNDPTSAFFSALSHAFLSLKPPTAWSLMLPPSGKIYLVFYKI